MISVNLGREDCLYHPYFCEENVWHLCGDSRIAGHHHVVFISNAVRQCPLWFQRAAVCDSKPVVWDYHVVLLSRAAGAGEAVIFDLDSWLPWPCPMAVYLASTFAPRGALAPEYEPRFRVIEGDVFKAHFTSTRSHMRAADGHWLHPPPPWRPILGAVPQLTLWRSALDMESAEQPGLLFELEALRQWGQHPP